MVRRKWWAVVALALVGAVLGYAISERANQAIKPLFEATTYVEFESELGDRSRDTTLELVRAAAEEARVYNATALEQRVGQLAIDEPNFRLLFLARSEDRTEAAVASESLRAAYVNGTAQARADERQARLDEIIIEAAEVLQQIERLTPVELIVEEPVIGVALQARIDSLQDLHDALDQQLTQLEVNLVLAQSGDERVDDPEEIQEQIDDIQFRMAAIRSELVVIALENGLNPADITPQTNQGNQGGSQTPAAPNVPQDPRDVTPDEVPEGGLTDQLTLDALEDRYGDLTSEFGDLFLEAESETPAVLVPVEVEDLTPSPVSAPLNAVLGLLAGALLGVGLLFASKSARGNIYGPTDIAPLPVIAELPSAATTKGRASTDRSGRLAGERADGVRQMRHAILRYVDSSPTTLVLGLSGVSVNDSEVSILALDIGNRLAASDRFVLVVDLNFDTTVHYEGSSGVTVSKLLQVMRNDRETGNSYFKETLIDGPEERKLRVVAPGSMIDDATDAVLTDGFVDLMSAARQHFDVILAVMPPASAELTQALRQRVDGVVAVVLERVSRRAALDLLLTDVDAGLAPALGAALLTGSPSSGFFGRIRNFFRPKSRKGSRATTSSPTQTKKATRAKKKEQKTEKKQKKAAAPTEPAPAVPAAQPSDTPAAEVPAPAAPAPAKEAASSPGPAPSRRTSQKPQSVNVPSEPPAPPPKKKPRSAPETDQVAIDATSASPNHPTPVSRTRAVVDWIKEWPYNDMEPLPQVPREQRLSSYDDTASSGR